VSGTRDAVVPLILARVADTPVTIPDKPAFKASEVCELMQIQPYVLRSWESEFPDLGISKTPGGPRVYRRADVERVLRIRDLVFTEGLTLSGVRRRFEAENPQPDDLFTLVASMESAPAAQPAAAPPPAGPKASTPPVAAPPVDEDTRARPASSNRRCARCSSCSAAKVPLRHPSRRRPAPAPGVGVAARRRATVRRRRVALPFRNHGRRRGWASTRQGWSVGPAIRYTRRSRLAAPVGM
jgi:DNA-binding transcriptional MerR regulator